MSDDPTPVFLAEWTTWRLSTNEPPLGIVGTIYTYEAKQAHIVERYSDELVLGGLFEPLIP